MVVSIELKNNILEIKKNDPKGYRKCQNIHIYLYILLSIFIEYSFWKDIKISEIFIFENISVILFYQIILFLPVLGSYFRQITRFFDEYIYVNNEKMVLIFKNKESIKDKIEIDIKDIKKIYKKIRNELFIRLKRGVVDEEFMPIKIETNNRIISWGMGIEKSSDIEKIIKSLNDFIKNEK